MLLISILALFQQKCQFFSTFLWFFFVGVWIFLVKIVWQPCARKNFYYRPLCLKTKEGETLVKVVKEQKGVKELKVALRMTRQLMTLLGKGHLLRYNKLRLTRAPNDPRSLGFSLAI